MIIDCFTFFNEYELLEARLEYLFKKVNYFVITESNMTFSGQPKRYNFIDNIERYSYFLDRIIYLPCVPPIGLGEAYWGIEHYQRNHLMRGISLFDPSTFVLMGDVDEIPSFDGIDRALAQLDKASAVSIQQDVHYYNLRQRGSNPWAGTVATRARSIQQKPPQEFRDMRQALPQIEKGGWHLSHWGGADRIREKLHAGSHREMNTEQYTDRQYIQQHIDEGKDLFDRPWEQYTPTRPEEFEQFFYQVFSPRQRF